MESVLPAAPSPAVDPAVLALRIKALAREAGFQRCGIAGIALGEDEAHLRDWLAQGLYGSMDWMARHGDKRARPAELIPGTIRVISVGLDYGRDAGEAWDTPQQRAPLPPRRAVSSAASFHGTRFLALRHRWRDPR